MAYTGSDSLETRKTLKVDEASYDYFSLKEAARRIGDIERLPFTLKILLENLLRFEDGRTVTEADVRAVYSWLDEKTSAAEVAFRPARVLMQDFTGVPAVVDLAAMRDAMAALGGDPERINPLAPVDLVIDHSVTVDEFGSPMAFKKNVEREFERNYERYAFLKWGQGAFRNFRVVPPGTGICHQVNLEYLAQAVWVDKDEKTGAMLAYPDTLVGTDSHTTMINGLGVLGWGVGGIEAEAVMLGQPVSMVIPEVIGFRFTGKLKEGATATDLVLTVTQMLRQKGVVGRFVEFFGDGLDNLTLADRATIGNMAPEYGATCGFFPIDRETVNYLSFTGRDPHRVKLVEAYAKEQGLWRESGIPDPVFTDTLELDLSTVEPSLAGPKRPQDRLALKDVAKLPSLESPDPSAGGAPVDEAGYKLNYGDVVIAAITSCTNTSNPSVMIAAGLLARNALAKGLKVKPWVKTSLAPGSQVVSDYLQKAGLQESLDALGFNLVGYGCTTCIGNSGPLPDNIASAVEKWNLNVCGVLSGNRNFEGRINPHVKSNFLASPPLVVAYAIAGTMKLDLTREPLGKDGDGRDVYLKDIWPDSAEISSVIAECITPGMFRERYANVFEGTQEWQQISSPEGCTYDWDEDSTYIKKPPYFDDMARIPEVVPDIVGARCLALLGDSVTTDHISPAGSIARTSPAGRYLIMQGVRPQDFNSYGARRGNHEVMMRGTFANNRIRNDLVPHLEGGFSKYVPLNRDMFIFEAAMEYMRNDNIPLIVIAGREYGTGSSRDWAAKGTRLLGVRAVIAESFERIHRSNLIGMGVLPLQFDRNLPGISGWEVFEITGLNSISPGCELTMVVTGEAGHKLEVPLLCRIDTQDELEYFRHGGILHYVLRSFLARE